MSLADLQSFPVNISRTVVDLNNLTVLFDDVSIALTSRRSDEIENCKLMSACCGREKYRSSFSAFFTVLLQKLLSLNTHYLIYSTNQRQRRIFFQARFGRTVVVVIRLLIRGYGWWNLYSCTLKFQKEKLPLFLCLSAHCSPQVRLLIHPWYQKRVKNLDYEAFPWCPLILLSKHHGSAMQAVDISRSDQILRPKIWLLLFKRWKVLIIICTWEKWKNTYMILHVVGSTSEWTWWDH